MDTRISRNSVVLSYNFDRKIDLASKYGEAVRGDVPEVNLVGLRLVLSVLVASMSHKSLLARREPQALSLRRKLAVHRGELQ